jgi:hypothetical protein
MRDLDFDFLKGLRFIMVSDLAKRRFRLEMKKNLEHLSIVIQCPFCRVKEGRVGQKAPRGSSHGRGYSHDLTVCLSMTHAAFCNVGGRMM